MNMKKRYDELRDLGHDHDEAQDILKRECIEKNLYTEFINYLLKEYYNHTAYAESFLDALVENQAYQPYKMYWKVRVTEEIRYMWELVDYWKNEKGKTFTTKDLISYDRKILDENQDKYPAYQDEWLSFVWHWYNTQDFIDIYIKRMQKIGATEEIERAKFLKECIYNLKKPKAKKTTDKRKMSEEVFWELIDESRKKSEFDGDFIETIRDKLEAMGASEIKKFQKILLEKMNELNRWDIWALAYVVRNGCGDDEFDYFKAWCVSKGKEAFEDVKAMRLEKLKELFEGGDPQLEEFMYVASEAYENKKYEEMPMPRVKDTPMQGEEWKEEKICERYPKLCAMFEYAS